MGGVILAAFVVWCFMLEPRHETARRFAFLWFVAAIAPSTTFTIAAVDRELYLAGPAWALLVGLAATWIWDALPRAVPARVCLTAVFVLAAGLSARQTWMYEHDIKRQSLVWQSFAQELRQTYPVLAPGSTLYVTNTPAEFAIFNYFMLQVNGALQGHFLLVDAFYSDVTVRVISADDVHASHLGPNEYLFEYRRPSSQ